MQLTIVAFVLRHQFASSAAPEGVGCILSDFLVSDMSLSRACEAGSPLLLDLVWHRGLRLMSSSHWSLAKSLHTEPHYYHLEFSSALAHAVRRGDLSMVKWLLDHFQNCPILESVVMEAAEKGDLKVLQYLQKDKSHGGISWTLNGLDHAADFGHWDIVHWMYNFVHSTPEARQSNTNLFSAAFRQNDLEQIQWGLERGFGVKIQRFPENLADAWPVCKDILQFLLESGRGGTEEIANAALYKAAEMGDLKFTQWLAGGELHNPDIFLRAAVELAGQGGHIPVVQWLLSRMDDLGLYHGPSRAMFAAAQSGNLELARWIYDRYKHDANVDLFRGEMSYRGSAVLRVFSEMDAAAANGHLDMLQFLQDIDLKLREKQQEDDAEECIPHRRCLTSALGMDVAAEGGHLDVVKWLHDHRTEGCTTYAMDRAAVNGHLKVVQWLRLNRTEGCTTDAMDKAAARLHHESECSSKTLLTTSCACNQPDAFVEEQIEILRWLNENCLEGCTTEAMDNAAGTGNLKVLKWLHKNTKAGCTTRAMDIAASHGRLDIVKWLHENRSEGCTSAAMDYAAANGHLEVVKWLHTNRAESCAATAMSAAAGRSRFSAPRQQFSVVRWLLSNSTDVNISFAMTKALYERNFDIVLLLHDHHPNFSDAELMKVKKSLDFWGHLYIPSREVRAWLEENYPSSLAVNIQ